MSYKEELTQNDCVIRWVDDDDQCPHEKQKLHSLFQSPVIDHLNRKLETDVQGFEDGVLSSVGSVQHLQPLRTQPIELYNKCSVDGQDGNNISFIKRRRVVRQARRSNVVDTHRAPLHPNTLLLANTPIMNGNDYSKKEHGLLFDLPSCWKEQFQTKSLDTPEEYSSTVIDASTVPETQASLSRARRETSSPPCSTQDDQSHISCCVDLGSSFLTTCFQQEDEPTSHHPCTITTTDVKDTTILDSSFEFIDLDAEDIAAVDAAIYARQTTQENLDHTFTVLNLSNHPNLSHAMAKPFISSSISYHNNIHPLVANSTLTNLHMVDQMVANRHDKYHNTTTHTCHCHTRVCVE